ncbi:Diamine acetyltransferase 2 [Perkinsus olseni]|uniref:Diamine acetyltransferase 2 n=1 Tax=Perkinsus olseni TaxID=32597 RepID=A0A7J6MC44_PEROL|nr:Diamine acetyltransferase 2 [Perkinsus olseni]
MLHFRSSSIIPAATAAGAGLCMAVGLLAVMKRRRGRTALQVEKRLSDGRQLVVREGTAADSHQIYTMLEKLVLFQKLPEDLLTADTIRHSSNNLNISSYDLLKDFLAGRYHTAIAEVEGSPVGYALFYPGYSTWDGKSIHLEDIYVDEDLRGEGIGRSLIEYVAKLAAREGYARMDWSAVDWNVGAHRFYESIGAKKESEWIPFVLDHDGIAALASSN